MPTQYEIICNKNNVIFQDWISLIYSFEFLFGHFIWIYWKTPYKIEKTVKLWRQFEQTAFFMIKKCSIAKIFGKILISVLLKIIGFSKKLKIIG